MRRATAWAGHLFVILGACAPRTRVGGRAGLPPTPADAWTPSGGSRLEREPDLKRAKGRDS